MSDTRTLLQKIQTFRQRLDALPRLGDSASDDVVEEPVAVQEPIAAMVEVGSRTQAILEQSVRNLPEPEVPTAVEVTSRAWRVLHDAKGLVGHLRSLADEPLLAGPPPGDGEEADPLAVWFRETAAMMGPAVRMGQSMPDLPSEQLRLCEGLEGILATVRQRLAILGTVLHERRRDAEQVDRLAHFLVRLNGDQPVEAATLVELASEVLAEGLTSPLRFLYAPPAASQAFLGGPSFPAPARFVACHSLTTARIMARIVRHAPEWKADLLQPVIAALLHDVGMLRLPPALLATNQLLKEDQIRLIEGHPRRSAELIANGLPSFAPIVEPIATHHERLDGTGYPSGLKGDQIPPLARLLAVADLYGAMCCPRPHREARDPRSALTDTLLYAEQNILDRFAAEKLLSLSFYPIGSVVELSDGAIGVVAANHPGRDELQLAGRPVLNLLIDQNGQIMPSPMSVDLATNEAGSVIRTLRRDERARLLGRHYPQWAI